MNHDFQYKKKLINETNFCTVNLCRSPSTKINYLAAKKNLKKIIIHYITTQKNKSIDIPVLVQFEFISS